MGLASNGYRVTEGSSATGEERNDASLQMELEQVLIKEAQRNLPPTPYTKTIPGFLPDTPNPGTDCEKDSPVKESVKTEYTKKQAGGPNVQSR
ncbi:hypothetical protein BY996DRAFT_6492102 [Phakopsora pachyrhizi]|nr:hypothetical protein BY996DRAFT_6492102 [Phakopsora pachyrhizi]